MSDSCDLEEQEVLLTFQLCGNVTRRGQTSDPAVPDRGRPGLTRILTLKQKPAVSLDLCERARTRTQFTRILLSQNIPTMFDQILLNVNDLLSILVVDITKDNF